MADLMASGMPPGTPRTSHPDRRLVVVGTIRRHGGRTITVRATMAGVTGTITTAPAAPAVTR